MARTTRVRRRAGRAGYSIAAILLLMATIGVMLGMARSLPPLWQLGQTSVINMVVGALGGVIIGGMLGMSHQRRFNGMLIGVFVGGIAGLCSGASTVGGRFQLPVIVIGSLAILLFAAVVRAASWSAAEGDASAAQGRIARLLEQMTARQVLALALVLLTGAFAATKVYELLNHQNDRSMPSVIGRLVLIGVLLALTAFLTRLVLHRPAASETPTDLSSMDVLDDPPERA